MRLIVYTGPDDAVVSKKVLLHRGVPLEVSDEEADRLLRNPKVEEYEAAEAGADSDEDADDDPLDGMHVGGGWYVLPSGDRVQGREAAEAALAAEPE